jgi:purine-nucleoside phosphorylase
MTRKSGRKSAGGNAERIRSQIEDRTPSLAIILGSGLGSLADELEERVMIPYAELSGWPRVGVAGHGGELAIGALAGRDVVMLKGRAHYYEHGRPDGMRTPIETLLHLGVRTLVLTNAAGSLRPSVGAGSVMLITDHIVWSGMNPLIGDEGDGRFVDLRDAYDPALCEIFRRAAAATKTMLHEGVYMWFSGPSFETPAEIRAARILGADAVGMSTVPEVILARRLGLQVAALSAITNLGAGMAEERLSHAHTQAQAERARHTLSAVLRQAVKELP